LKVAKPYITSVERIGFKRGFKDGFKRGFKRGFKNGLTSFLAKLIAKKYKAEMEQELTYLAGLEFDEIEELSVLILDFESLDEVHEWIDEHVGQKEAVL